MSTPFRTEYVGPTATKGARIVVTSLAPVAGKLLRHAMSFPHEGTPTEAHDMAASQFIARWFHLETNKKFLRTDVGKGFLYAPANWVNEVTL